MNGARARLARLPRRFSYALIAVGLAVGAPVGLLVIRLAATEAITAGAIGRELAGDSPTYLYVLLSTLAVFASFGYVLGRQADALVGLSRTDPLTGLSNTLAFDVRLHQEHAIPALEMRTQHQVEILRQGVVRPAPRLFHTSTSHVVIANRKATGQPVD